MERAAVVNTRHRDVSGTFSDELFTAFDVIRRLLSDLLGDRGISIEAAGDMARVLKLNRNIAWRVSKMLTTEDRASALAHLPGDDGLEALFRALDDRGSPASAVDRLRRAAADFDRVVTTHAGDRDTLELILDGMDGVGASERLERSRRLAFRGLSGVWGVQARVRSSTNFIAPNAQDPSRLDLGVIGGVVDFRRLRSGPRWPLFRPRSYDEQGEPNTPCAVEALDPRSCGERGPKLLRDYCSPNMPEIAVVEKPRGSVYELTDWPVGNTGAFTCFFGHIQRAAAPRSRTKSELHAEIYAHIGMPAEHLQFDLIVHESLSHMLEPEVLSLGQPDGGGPLAASALGPGGAHTIPVGASTSLLEGVPPMLGSPLIPRYDEMIERVFTRLGWDLRSFRALRLTVKYPPMNATVLMRSELPE